MLSLAKSTEQPPALSAARQALADHLARMRATYDQLSAYSGLGEKLGAALKKQQDAAAALTTLERDEDEAWTRWALDATGPQPETDHKKRADLKAAIASAAEEIATGERAIAAVDPRARELVAHLHGLEQQRAPLVAAILLEEGTALAVHYQHLIWSCIEPEVGLDTIRHWAFGQNQTELGCAAIDLLRGKALVLSNEHREARRQARASARRRWVAYCEALSGDPTATIETGDNQ
jgi:hypothetical protein